MEQKKKNNSSLSGNVWEVASSVENGLRPKSGLAFLASEQWAHRFVLYNLLIMYI